MAWQKVSDKLYQITLDGKYVDIKVPYAKTEKVFSQFVGSGGLIDEYGTVTTDAVALISNFTEVGNILLTEYGPKGVVVSQGDCGELSAAETVELFQIATDVVESFTQLISSMQKKTEEVSEEVKEPQKLKKKTA